MDFQELLDQIEKYGSRKIIEGPQSLAYSELAAKCNQIHAFLRSNGFAAGDRIAVATTDDLEACPLIFACFRFGIPVALIDPGAKKPEAEQLISRLQLKGIFLDQGLAEDWSPDVPFVWMIKKQKNKLISRLLGKKTNEASAKTYPECLDSFDRSTQHPPPESHGDVPALLLCTSGTTGHPKILQLSMGNLMNAARTTSQKLELDSDITMLDLLPLTHYDGVVSGLFTAFYRGATIVRLGPFAISLLPDIFDAIYKYRCTHLLLTPSILGLMLQLGEEIQDSFRTEDFRFVISVASTLPAKLCSDFQELTGKKVVNVYGLSETGNNLFAGPDEESYRIGSIGKPIDCDVLIIREDGSKAEAGETGELLLRAPSITSGYLGEPLPVRSIDGTDWFPTGDLGYCDDSGIYWLLGRKKNIIIAGGRNIYPDEINDALSSHPAVMEAATLGLPDDIWGERVVSTVVVKNGVTASELLEYAATRLTDYKVPREIHFLTELPKGRSGKVLLNELALRLKNNVLTSAESALAGLEEQVVQLAAQSFRTPASELSMKTTPETCGRWDSVAHMDFVTNLEAKFGVELHPREVIQITSLQDAVRIVRNKLTGVV